MKIDSAMITKWIFILVGIIVIVEAASVIVPDIGTAGNKLNDTYQCETIAGGTWNDTATKCQVNTTNTTAIDYINLGLAGLFTSDGVVILIIMAALLIAVIAAIIIKGKKR